MGFDWGEIEGALKKIEEEIDEFRNAETDEDKAEEMGDMFFALAKVSRWFGIDPESALRETNAKFKRRFKVIEAEAIKKGVSLSDMSLEEMDAIWEESKKGDLK